jgi:glycosyltransferase involved in cell wall biosynthesis
MSEPRPRDRAVRVAAREDPIVNRRRVAVLINSLGAGGAERAATVLVAGLQARGVRVEILCLERDRFYEVDNGVPVTYLSRVTAQAPGIVKLLMLAAYAVRLRRMARERHFAVVQSHLFRSNYVNCLSRLLGSPHRVQVVNGGQVSRYRTKGLAGWANLLLTKWLYGVADVVVAKSQGMRRDIVDTLGLKDRIVVINNPYDLESIRRLAREPVSESWYREGRPVVVCVGRLISLKRPADVIRAFASLAAVNPFPHLAFLGDGPERKELEQTARMLGIEERCTFLGTVRNPFKYMARAACLVNASSSEGFPNVVVEALCSGCPVVCSDCQSGPREILAPDTDPCAYMARGFRVEKAGILFGVGDLKALAEALVLVIGDRALAGRLRRAGLLRCQEYHRDEICRQYAGLIEG